MVSNPDKYIEKICYYNIEYITIHYEIKNLEDYIDKIKNYGFKVGIAIKPETDIEKIYYLLDKINLVLIMSVEPGKSGQKFIDVSDKINKLKQEIINEAYKMSNISRMLEKENFTTLDTSIFSSEKDPEAGTLH